MEKYEKVIQNNKYKISALTLNDKFDLSNGSHSAPHIQNYFEYIIKNMKQ